MGGFFGGGGASVDLASPPAIGNTTPNTGAFTTLSANNGTITASNPIFSASQTWNNAAVAFTSISISITNTASSSSSRILNLLVGASSVLDIDNQGSIRLNNASGNIKFSSPSSTRGIEWGTNSCLVSEADEIYYFRRGASGSRRFGIFSDGVALDSGGSYSWTSGQASATRDLFLTRDAAQILAQRNSTNAQTFRIYNTFTDASNYERGFLSWTSNTFRIGTEKAGTGSQRNLEIYTDGTLRMYVTNNAVRLTNNAYLTLGTGGVLPEGGGASNYLLFRNNSGTELGRFQGNGIFSFTGTTSSFPALKPSSAVLQVRLADDSGYTVLDAQLRAQGTAPATAGATGTAGDIRYDADYIYICTATNTWKRVAIATWP